MKVCFLSVLSLGLPYLFIASYPTGILQNGYLQNIPSTCSLCFNQSMNLPLDSIQLLTCSAEYLFVASVNIQGEYLLGAYGDRYDVLNEQSTVSQAFGPSNQVYWYFIPHLAFGFSPTIKISLNPCDDNDPLDPFRMSWILDSNQGGCRVGKHVNSSQNSNLFKVAYACKYNGDGELFKADSIKIFTLFV